MYRAIVHKKWRTCAWNGCIALSLFVWRCPDRRTLWLCPAQADDTDKRLLPWMYMEDLQNLVGWATTESVQEQGRQKPCKRPCHLHPQYGDGEFGQRVVPPLQSNPGSSRDPCRPQCGHPTCNWNGQLWRSQHDMGCQIHDWNRKEFATHDADWQSFVQIMFYHDYEPEPRGLRERIKGRPHWIWYKMATHNAGYRGYHAVCTVCGAVMQCAYTPSSTRGWRDHQRANLLQFCGFPVPELYTRPLEETLPMV